MKKNSMVLNSANPLPNELLKLKKLYFVCVGVCILGGIMVQITPAILLIGALATILLYVIDDLKTTSQRDKLRLMKFQYDSSVSTDALFGKLQESMISKYGGKMLLERGTDGKITITFDDHIYDVHIEDDVFTIWWRKSLGNALFSFNKYKSYKKLLIAYGLIAYEIQTCTNVELQK